MKKRLTLIAVTLSIVLISCVNVLAQNTDDPVGYLSAVGKAQDEMNKKYMAYLSTVAHGRRARKVEKMRKQVLETIDKSRMATSDLPFYKGDNTLRKAGMDYIQFCYRVFNEDYEKIVNMEEIAEQSFDQMQAYILLQEKAEEKIKEATAIMTKAQEDFAAKHNIKLVDTKTELGEKMATASKLNKYNNKVYMVFFKSNWQDAMLVKAINENKINDIEQSRNALITYSKEGMLALDSLKNFQGDPSLAVACRQVLTFYRKMAENDIPKVTDFLLKQENFEKIKKSFESKPASSRTKEDVAAFNKAVDEYNKAVNTYNQANNAMNSGRKQALENWNKTYKEFADNHMPYFK